MRGMARSLAGSRCAERGHARLCAAATTFLDAICSHDCATTNVCLMQVPEHSNDGQILFEQLKTALLEAESADSVAQTVSSVFQGVQGPFAFVFYHVRRRRLVQRGEVLFLFFFIFIFIFIFLFYLFYFFPPTFSMV